MRGFSEPLILWCRLPDGFKRAKDNSSMQEPSGLLVHRDLQCLQIPGIARL